MEQAFDIVDDNYRFPERCHSDIHPNDAQIIHTQLIKLTGDQLVQYRSVCVSSQVIRLCTEWHEWHDWPSF